nr:MAG TPA: hypothetical protein [Crassvirales sp.]
MILLVNRMVNYDLKTPILTSPWIVPKKNF